ncbi:MAG: sodium ion-translocating decarboxylase subunit beta [Clostridia bacterium]|nr:sodium ion-translocating decarboxylase subunit beta [Clostridia bacterium]
MVIIACVLCYLAIVKKFEPLLLLPIAIGMLLTNLPGAGVYHEVFFAGGHIQWDLIGGNAVTFEKIIEIAFDLGINENIYNGIKFIADGNLADGAFAQAAQSMLDAIGTSFADWEPEAFLQAFNVAANGIDSSSFASEIVKTITDDSHIIEYMYNNLGSSISIGLIDILYLGVKLGIYPCLIFIGVGAMTDFGPLLANPKSLLLGAAAQVGIFATFAGVMGIGALGYKLDWEPIKFIMEEAASIGIIGGADGPTAIFVTSKLAPQLLGPIAVAAYSYMALVPVIQPPIMKLLTTKKERQIRMDSLRPVSKKAKIIFPIVIIVFVALLVPDAVALIGSLMLGNLLRECGVTERLSKTVQNELMNIVTIFLGISVGATATAATFLQWKTIIIIAMGIVAFGVATASGVLIAKLMNLFLPKGKKINPLIGSAGVSAVPMAARVSQKVGQEADPGNFLLMHAMGPNVAGVIGSAIAAGVLISLVG